jgi:hypothetical protein
VGGCAVAAPFLRLGRAGFAAPLCKNGDATWGSRDPRTVDRAEDVQAVTSARCNEQLRDGRAVGETQKTYEQ